MQGENLQKFTETRAPAPRARHALILPRPKIQYRMNEIENHTVKHGEVCLQHLYLWYLQGQSV